MERFHRLRAHVVALRMESGRFGARGLEVAALLRSVGDVGRPTQAHRCLAVGPGRPSGSFRARTAAKSLESQPQEAKASSWVPAQRRLGHEHTLLGPTPRVADGVRRHPVVLGTVDASQPDAATHTRHREACHTTQARRTGRRRLT